MNGVLQAARRAERRRLNLVHIEWHVEALAAAAGLRMTPTRVGPS
jgi:hypothetical protein